ncbi:unnamed protein product [Peronospora belbahrii]|uniref:Uncharacterized protein n=1 Tax=Peronospora belbahrii TaxID=622444 RepID=A0AAU9KXA7_9STRA|nr:unnamed protein product [Peronospora belbahrii]
MVVTNKEANRKPKRGSFIGLGGLLPKVSTYRNKEIKNKNNNNKEGESIQQQQEEEEAEEEPVQDHQEEEEEQLDKAKELPDFSSECRSHDHIISTPSAASVAAAAIRRRGMSIEQTATSLYRRISVRQNSALESMEGATSKSSLTGSIISSPSFQFEPELKYRRGTCVATIFGTGIVLDVRIEDGFYVIQLVPKSIAYLLEDTIIREIKSIVGERVKTRWGMATVEQYYIDDDMYSIALDWRWDDEHVWPLYGRVLVPSLIRLPKSFAVNTKHDALTNLDKAQTPFGVCTVLEVRPDKLFVGETPCGATAYLNAESVRILGRRTHFASGDRVDTPFGPGLIGHFRDDDETYAVELEVSPLAGQSPLLFISDVHAESNLTLAPAASNTRLSSILNLTRASMINAGERMRSASVAAGGLPTLPANLPALPGNLPTLSSVKAKVSTMATIKMTSKAKFHKDERVLTMFGSGFIVEARAQEKIYLVNLRRLKFSGYFHESSLARFPYERVTHFVVDGRTVPAPPIPKNASGYKRRAVITAAIKSARESYVDKGDKLGTPINAAAAVEAAVAVDTSTVSTPSIAMPVSVAQ